MKESAQRNRRQAEVVETVKSHFGEASLNIQERAMRFLEEAIELAQAAGISYSDARRLVHYVFGRPKGEPGQELGGVGVTLLALAYSLDHEADECEVAELRRVQALPADYFRDRHARKVEQGIAQAAVSPGAEPTEFQKGVARWLE